MYDDEETCGICGGDVNHPPYEDLRPVALLCPDEHEYMAVGTVDDGGFTPAEGTDARCAICGKDAEGMA